MFNYEQQVLSYLEKGYDEQDALQLANADEQQAIVEAIAQDVDQCEAVEGHLAG